MRVCFAGSDVINKHKELPPVTDSKVSFRKYATYRGSALPMQARIHGKQCYLPIG